MWTCSRSFRHGRQRGDVLLEALVGVLVTSLIGAGLAHVQARLMASQRETKIERMVVERLRDRLQAGGTGLCASDTLDVVLDGDLRKQARVACAAPQALTVSVGGTTLEVEAPRQVDLSVPATELDLDGAGAGAGDADLLLSTRQ